MNHSDPPEGSPPSFIPPLSNYAGFGMFEDETEQTLERTIFNDTLAGLIEAAVEDVLPRRFFEHAQDPNTTSQASLAGTEQASVYPPFWYEESPHTDEEMVDIEETPNRFISGTGASGVANVYQTTAAGMNENTEPSYSSLNTLPATKNKATINPTEKSVAVRNEKRSRTVTRRNAGESVAFDTYGELEEYPASTEPLPAELSIEELCTSYPNHLNGEGLDPFIQRMLTGLDIFNLLHEDTVAALQRDGIMSADKRNRANFLTKRLDRRMLSLGFKGMKELIEKPKLRHFKDPKRENQVGRSKLRGLYPNPHAQPRRQYGKVFDRISKTKGTLKEDENETEEEAFTASLSGAEALTSNPFTPIPLTQTNHLIDYEPFFSHSPEYVRYSAAMADQWLDIRETGHLILSLDQDLRNPNGPLYAATLLDFGLWTITDDTEQFVFSDDIENSPAWDYSIQQIFIDEFERVLAESNGEDLLVLQQRAVDHIIVTRQSQLQRLERLLTRGQGMGTNLIQNFVRNEYYGQGAYISACGYDTPLELSSDLAIQLPNVSPHAQTNTQTHYWSNVSDDDWLAYHSNTGFAIQPSAPRDATHLVQNSQTWIEPSYNYDAMSFDAGSGTIESQFDNIDPRLRPNYSSPGTSVHNSIVPSFPVPPLPPRKNKRDRDLEDEEERALKHLRRF
ncbi:hypothetical protein LTR84_005039 [Exophiala bonariae]|uniref:Uncharacterized protein n=1 Tax=Exophiala bonariae TaxID=1690606 RepID=A0AAV9NP72_9EURO|nr:hypothetical protein LTR84_005039 [Exophiala bonariae]